MYDNLKLTKEEKELLDIQDDFKKTFSTAAGQRVLKHLENRSFVNNTLFSDSHSEMAFREGHRRFFLIIRDYVKMKPESLLNMFKQRKDSQHVGHINLER